MCLQLKTFSNLTINAFHEKNFTVSLVSRDDVNYNSFYTNKDKHMHDVDLASQIRKTRHSKVPVMVMV